MPTTPPPTPEPARTEPRTTAEWIRFAQRAFVVSCVVAAVALGLLFIWYAAPLLLLVFAGILVSIPLRLAKHAIEERTPLGSGASLTVVLLALTALLVTTGGAIVGSIMSQATTLASQLQEAARTVQERMQDSAWAGQILQQVPSLTDVVAGRTDALSRVFGLASSTLTWVVNALIVIVVGIYVAAQPQLYSQGLRHVLPFRWRRRADDVLAALDAALSRWLVGRLALMVANGALTTIALWLLGVPLAFTLGVLAGLLNFIPNFGPIIAAIPAVLIAFAHSPSMALYTALVYVAVQMVDGYVLTPLVDRRSVELPPALTIAAQVLLGVLFGFIGLLVASPLTACALILVKMLYVEDLLGDEVMQDSPVDDAVREAQRQRVGREPGPSAAADNPGR
ncbi:MAG TPA: AI-2E family transporter [Vicinamibacterales bacterium]